MQLIILQCIINAKGIFRNTIIQMLCNACEIQVKHLSVFILIFFDIALYFQCIDNGQLENDVLNNRQILFKNQTLVTAIANCHDDSKVGEGGFGSVYKVT